MKLGRLGVWWFTDALKPAQLIELAQRSEQLGYGTLWYSEVVRHESFGLGSFLLANTKSIIVASGIANIYARDATTTKQGQHTLAAVSGGRFLLGLGVSHVPLVETARGHEYLPPVPAMRAYLDALDKAAAMAPRMRAYLDAVDKTAAAAPRTDDPAPILAALGPRMIALAAARGAGALSYNSTPEHTVRARALLGPDKLLCVEQKVLLATDPGKAREVARQAMAFYMPLANFRANWSRLGFSEEDLAGAGSDRLMDAMVAWGSEAAIRSRIQAHFDAGADHVCIQPLHPDGLPTPDYNALTALAS
jgi:probable F420-dependent oxidoreductase